MPDISMCLNDECKFKKDCYRFTATPGEFMQTYALFKCKDKGKEGYFWSNKPYKLKKK